MQEVVHKAFRADLKRPFNASDDALLLLTIGRVVGDVASGYGMLLSMQMGASSIAASPPASAHRRQPPAECAAHLASGDSRHPTRRETRARTHSACRERNVKDPGH